MDAPERSPLRFLAPLGLITFVVVLFMILGSYGAGSGGSSSPAGTNDPAPTPTEPAPGDGAASGEPRPAPERERRRRAGRSVYIVKTGDTLGDISEEAGVPVESIQELNPEVDPQALVAGQRIKLRE